ncbi:DUF2141 domain-containing protein [Gillisia limnaea]|uniref:DUF2141 domain-containing protein n=1 Tax=Gillisia limnaea (strain DSM 15749 / LMG 21470 / R-8282) TaxID=865937 RepID=H2BV43_GILLR|nr:DUF2141 domain-containing protein [Gillisia limnaea]EHQ03933.1 Protein of unknown function DUF2141 [Gillisia limnaea DSM 15749]
MKKWILIMTLFVCVFAYSQTENTSTVTVNVNNLSTDEGFLLIGIYTEKIFMKSTPKYTAKGEIKNGSSTITFEGIPPGSYAISGFHDLNGNNKMDFQPTGKPGEPYGISKNNINPNGPPIWEDSKFEVSGVPVEMEIKFL